jgi:hypothetical protein
MCMTVTFSYDVYGDSNSPLNVLRIWEMPTVRTR